MSKERLSFDFSDMPDLVEMLRVYSIQNKCSLKAVLIEALEALFANKLENSILQGAASVTFAEWDNDEDSVYDSL